MPLIRNTTLIATTALLVLLPCHVMGLNPAFDARNRIAMLAVANPCSAKARWCASRPPTRRQLGA